MEKETKLYTGQGKGNKIASIEESEKETKLYTRKRKLYVIKMQVKWDYIEYVFIFAILQSVRNKFHAILNTSHVKLVWLSFPKCEKELFQHYISHNVLSIYIYQGKLDPYLLF